MEIFEANGFYRMLKSDFVELLRFFKIKVDWKSAILNFAAISKDFPKICSIKVDVWVVLQKVAEIF
jgi:hypothetical protein